jgi:hypothetical protein
VLIAKGAEIRRNSEFVEFDHEQRQLEAAETASQKTYEQINPRIVPESVGLIWSIENPEVVARCVEILLELQQRIRDNGFDRTEDEFLLKIIYGDQGAAHLRQTLHDKYLTCSSRQK